MLGEKKAKSLPYLTTVSRRCAGRRLLWLWWVAKSKGWKN